MTEQAVYVLEKMAHGFKRLGRAGGAGFYEYEDDGEKALWSGLSVFGRSARSVPLDDIRDRLIYASVLAVLHGSAAASGSKQDAAIESGLDGAARQFVNDVGLSGFVARANELATRYGERFAPPHLLVERAQRGESV